MEDKKLMLEVIAGDIRKAGILYEKYKKSLFAYFYKLTCGDCPSSEDLVHTVFYRVIRYRKTFTIQINTIEDCRRELGIIMGILLLQG